jgi:hypothetical protein
LESLRQVHEGLDIVEGYPARRLFDSPTEPCTVGGLALNSLGYVAFANGHENQTSV